MPSKLSPPVKILCYEKISAGSATRNTSQFSIIIPVQPLRIYLTQITYLSALLLLVLRVFANYHDFAMSSNDFTFFTDGFN